MASFYGFYDPAEAGAYGNGAGSVSLADPNAFTYTAGNWGSFGGGGLTAPAQANLAAFSQGAFNSISAQGAAAFQSVASSFTTWADWQHGFSDRVATIFEKIANKSAKAPTGILGSIFGF